MTPNERDKIQAQIDMNMARVTSITDQWEEALADFLASREDATGVLSRGIAESIRVCIAKGNIIAAMAGYAAMIGLVHVADGPLNAALSRRFGGGQKQ